MIKEDNLTLYTRQELKAIKASDFKEGEVVVCNGYYVHIKYGTFKRPSLLTTVSHRYDIRNLPMNKHPQYIRNFIER